MANVGWGHGRPAETDTGISQILIAYATQGGQLLGARRWPDNPLTLTHVRWQGPNGVIMEAFRTPGNDTSIDESERKIWVELALHFPTMHSGGGSAEAPWQPLPISREQATEWASILRQSRSRRSYPASGISASGVMARSLPGISTPEPHRLESYGYTSSHSPISERPSHHSQYDLAQRPASEFAGNTRSIPELGTWTSTVQRNQFEAPEVAILPSVEIELPPQIDGLDAAEYRRDFASDAARHFNRAVHTIPQVREVRGWIRGDRLVLAARFVIGMGMRQPTRAEMESVARLLSEVLAQRTLPYSKLGFADPGEWTQGAQLPE